MSDVKDDPQWTRSEQFTEFRTDRAIQCMVLTRLRTDKASGRFPSDLTDTDISQMFHFHLIIFPQKKLDTDINVRIITCYKEKYFVIFNIAQTRQTSNFWSRKENLLQFNEQNSIPPFKT